MMTKIDFKPADTLTDDLRDAMNHALATVPAYKGDNRLRDSVRATWNSAQNYIQKIRAAAAAGDLAAANEWLTPLAICQTGIRPWNGPERDLVLAVRDAIRREFALHLVSSR